jgi:hypothetical protein
MAKIWVHINTLVFPDSTATKDILTPSLKGLLKKVLVDLAAEALPADKFTAKPTDKPTGTSKTYNALKLTETLNFKVETAGSKQTVSCALKMEFEGIKTPSTDGGNLIISGSKGAAADNRGSGEQSIATGARDALEAIVEPLVKKLITSGAFTAYGKSQGLPL